jgi:putative radical SAM enzyme (TIGR03279 family)
MRHSGGGRIARVVPGSLAEAAGLRPGDVLLSINGHILRDVIDYRFYSAEEFLELVVERNGAPLTLTIEREYGEDLGLEFIAPTFDGIRRCRNQCDFCFINQMPPGLRKSLYIKDDDYRYSFLFGNFITLTNLEEQDWARIAEQRLSPLYVSVHATDRKLRARLLGVPVVPDILAQIQRLGDMGIEVHAQIVVVPGLNNGAALERTVQDLADLYPTVCSIGVVPVGITRYHSGGLRPVTSQEAKRIVAQIRAWQYSYRQQHGIALVYAADELYLMAGLRLPPAEAYDGFPQLANGIGLTRQLLDDWRRVKRRGRIQWTHNRATFVCGTLIAPILQAIARELTSLTDANIDVVSVPNQFFGPTVTVSGLLVAADVIQALRGRIRGDLVVLPASMFDASGQVTLDDYRQQDIERELGVRVAVADRLSEVLSLS